MRVLSRSRTSAYLSLYPLLTQRLDNSGYCLSTLPYVPDRHTFRLQVSHLQPCNLEILRLGGRIGCCSLQRTCRSRPPRSQLGLVYRSHLQKLHDTQIRLRFCKMRQGPRSTCLLVIHNLLGLDTLQLARKFQQLSPPL